MNSKQTIGVILNIHLPYDRKIIRGIAAFMRTRPTWSLYVEEDPLQKLANLHAWHGDGLIVDFDDRRVAEAVAGLKTPVVGFGGGSGWYDPKQGVPYFETDDPLIAKMAATHLLERGFEHFAFCGYPPTRVNVWSQRREEVFVQHVASAGYACDVFHGRHATAKHWEQLQRHLAEWLRKLPKPLALMACNDVRARHVLEACRTIGARVPDDIAVIGVDNDEMMCELAVPPLSSVEQGVFRMGYEAAALLDTMIKGENPQQLRYRIEPSEIITRQSTDVLAVADREVAAALRQVRREATQGLAADQVSAGVGLSRSTLDRRFKSSIGRTVAQEIQRVQFEQAKQLLSGTDLTLKQVASRVGYANVQYLNALVRKNTGRTPSEYRKATGSASSALPGSDALEADHL